MITTKDKLLIGGGILLVIALILINFFVNPTSKPPEGGKPKEKPLITTRVTSVEPLQKQKGLSVVPQIAVNFSSAVKNWKVELKSSPDADFTTQLDKAGNKAIFSPEKSLEPNTVYNLQVFVENQPIFSWSISTKNVGASQTDLATVVNKVREQTPYTENGFRISYDAATDQFFIFIEQAPYQTFRDKAVSWLKQNGLEDFAALNINYVAKGSIR